MNLYANVTMQQRKKIDADLRNRAKPKMVYQTSEIRYRPNVMNKTMEPYAHPIMMSPYKKH